MLEARGEHVVCWIGRKYLGVSVIVIIVSVCRGISGPARVIVMIIIVIVGSGISVRSGIIVGSDIMGGVVLVWSVGV